MVSKIDSLENDGGFFILIPESSWKYWAGSERIEASLDLVPKGDSKIGSDCDYIFYCVSQMLSRSQFDNVNSDVDLSGVPLNCGGFEIRGGWAFATPPHITYFKIAKDNSGLFYVYGSVYTTEMIFNGDEDAFILNAIARGSPELLWTKFNFNPGQNKFRFTHAVLDHTPNSTDEMTQKYDTKFSKVYFLGVDKHLGTFEIHTPNKINSIQYTYLKHEDKIDSNNSYCYFVICIGAQ